MSAKPDDHGRWGDGAQEVGTALVLPSGHRPGVLDLGEDGAPLRLREWLRPFWSVSVGMVPPLARHWPGAWAIRHLLRRRGITVTIPGRRDQAANRRRRGRLGRPPAFDEEVYRERNVVERRFVRPKQLRAIATRFDKLADRYRAGVVLASLILWLRETSS